MNIREKILTYGSWAVLFLMPLVVFSNRVFAYATSKTFFLYGTIEILFTIWVYILFINRSYRLQKKQLILLIPIGCYLGWMTISGIVAQNTHMAFWSSFGRGTGLLTLYHAIAFLLIVVSLSNKYGFKRYIINTLLAIFSGGFMLALSVWFGDEGFQIPIGLFQKSGGGGLSGNSSLAGAYLLIVGALGIFILSTRDVSRKVKSFVVVGLLFTLFSPIFINLIGFFKNGNLLGSARGALIGIFVALVCYVITILLCSLQKWHRFLGASFLIISIISFGLGWKSLITPGTALHQKFITVASETRFTFWHIAQEAINEKPFFGYGPENFPVAVSHYFVPRMLDKSLAFEAWTDRAHNVYFDTGVSGGYPAIVFYAIFFISIIYAGSIGYKNEKLNRKQLAAIVGLVIGYVFQNLFYFDSTISIIVLYTIAGIVYTLAYIKNNEIQDKNVTDNKAQNYLIIPVLILVLSCSWYFFAYKPAQKSKLFAEIIGGSVNKRSDRYIELLGGSSVGNDWDVSGFAHDLYRLYARDPIGTKSNQKLLPYAQKDVLKFIEYMEEIAKTNKTDYRLYISIVHLYSTYIYLTDMSYNEDIATKITTYLQYAQKLSVNDPQVYWGFAQIAAWRNDIGEVANNYKKAIELDPSLPASHKLLLQLLQATGNQKLYKQALEYAQQQIPGFAI